MIVFIYLNKFQGNFEATSAEAHQSEEEADADRQPPGGRRQRQGGARGHGHPLARQGEEGQPRLEEGAPSIC